MKKLLFVLALSAFAACGNGGTTTDTEDTSTMAPADTSSTMPADTTNMDTTTNK
jgi:hypothetical protein